MVMQLHHVSLKGEGWDGGALGSKGSFECSLGRGQAVDVRTHLSMGREAGINSGHGPEVTIGGSITRVMELTEITDEMLEAGQESSNRLVPLVVKSKPEDGSFLGLLGGTSCHALFHGSNKLLVESLGITFIATSCLARVLPEDTSGRGFLKGVCKDSKCVGLKEIKQGLLIGSGGDISGVKDMAETLSISSGPKGPVPRVPLLSITELGKGSSITFDPLFELVSRGEAHGTSGWGGGRGSCGRGGRSRGSLGLAPVSKARFGQGQKHRFF